MALKRDGNKFTYYTTLLVGLAGLGIPNPLHASNGGSSGSVTTHLNANAGGACSANYQHIWVTVTDVKAHLTSAGWQDLTPGLSANPIQVDLLNAAPTDCFLATLGVTTGLPAGKYQQIRIYLDDGGKGKGKGKAIADNGKGKKGGGTPPAVNACTTGGLAANVYNCIELADNSFVPLSLSSEGNTGIKIPPGQITGGGLKISAGQGVDLDIDFNACESIVVAGKSGQYKLKPTLHAGEVDLSSLIAGTVVEGSINGNSVDTTATAVPGASLWLESQSPVTNFNIGNPLDTGNTTQVENVVATASSGPDGTFEFCPVPAGSYEIVADSSSMPGGGNASNATITTGITVTNNGGPNNLLIPLLDDGTSPALLEGLFTTQALASAGAGDDIAFGGVQPFSGNSGTVQAVIPPLIGTLPAPAGGALPVAATIASPTAGNCPDISSPSCPAGTNCECFTLALPGSNPVIGAAGSTYATPEASPSPSGVSVIGSASYQGSADCSPSDMTTDPASPIVVTGGTPTVAPTPTLSYANCHS